MSSRYREYKPSATRRTSATPLPLNHVHGDLDDGLILGYKDIFRVRPFDENDPYMPRKSCSSRYPMSLERADDWDVKSITNASVRADHDGGHRKAGGIDVRRNGGRRITLSSIEDYEIGDLLGSGGFGKVFRAVGISGPCMGKEVAIKMIDKSKTRTPALRRRIANEVEIQCQLSHPSILTLHDYFEDRDGVYMVMELCAGGELYRYLQRRRRPLSEAEARGVMEQLVHGLLYMHKNGILHRDLKLSNVLLTDRFEVKIADFGLATKLSEHGEQKTMCGTPNYISPEIVSRQPYGLASDVWSLGCMLVTFLTGKPPFESQQLSNPADQLKNTLDRVVKADYRLPKTLSAEAKDLVQRLLQLDPNRRLSLTRILDHPFFDHRLPVVPLKSDLGHGEDDERWEEERILPRRSCSRSLNEVGSIISVGERGRLRERERDRERQREMEQEREHERERIRELQCEREKQNERELEQEQQHQRETEREREHERLLEGNREKEKSRPRQPSYSRSQDRVMIKPTTVVNKEPMLSSVTSGSATITQLSTRRVRPIKQRTRHGVVEVLEDGTVFLDFNEERWLMTVNSEGERINFFERCHTHGSPAILVNPVRSYAFHELPPKHLKKYRYAAKFVDLVKSKTPKIIFYSPQAKCILMENGPLADFEMQFYNGIKVHNSVAHETLEIQIPPRSGSSDPPVVRRISTANTQRVDVPSDFVEVFRHTQECLRRCIEVERSGKVEEEERLGKAGKWPLILTSSRARRQEERREDDAWVLDDADDDLGIHRSTLRRSGSISENGGYMWCDQRTTVWPARRENAARDSEDESGMRPSQRPRSMSRTRGPSSGSNEPVTSAMTHAATTCTSSSSATTRTASTAATSISSLPTAFAGSPASFQYMRDVGWCLRSADGQFTMCFWDGVRVVVEARIQVVRYFAARNRDRDIEEDRQMETFPISKDLPRYVKDKLAYFPEFMKLFDENREGTAKCMENDRREELTRSRSVGRNRTNSSSYGSAYRPASLR